MTVCECCKELFDGLSDYCGTCSSKEFEADEEFDDDQPDSCDECGSPYHSTLYCHADPEVS